MLIAMALPMFASTKKGGMLTKNTTDFIATLKICQRAFLTISELLCIVRIKISHVYINISLGFNKIWLIYSLFR